MSKFVERTTAPTIEDYNQINVAYKNGLNHCIVINKSNGSVLPNCTGYTHFRWLELGRQLGLDYKTIEDRLCLSNAENYWPFTSDGYSRGQVPKLGSIIVWRKGATYSQSDGAGHVAIVEAINRDSSGKVISITCSASNYGGTRWYRSTYKASSNYYIGSLYTFLGFIYFPYDFEEVTIGTPVPRNENVDQVFVKINNLNARDGAEGTKFGMYVTPGYYDVYSSKESGGYVWYKIQLGVVGSKDLWAADVGMDYLPKKVDPSEWQAKYEELLLKYNELLAYSNSQDKKIADAIAVLK